MSQMQPLAENLCLQLMLIDTMFCMFIHLGAEPGCVPPRLPAVVDELSVGQVSGVDPAERREDDERAAEGSALQHHPFLPVRPHQRPRVLHFRQKPRKYCTQRGTRNLEPLVVIPSPAVKGP